MSVVNLRDAIILALLKDNFRTKQEIAESMKIAKTNTGKSLNLLKSFGLVQRKTINGKEIYFITDDGRNALQNVYRKIEG